MQTLEVRRGCLGPFPCQTSTRSTFSHILHGRITSASIRDHRRIFLFICFPWNITFPAFEFCGDSARVLLPAPSIFYEPRHRAASALTAENSTTGFLCTRVKLHLGHVTFYRGSLRSCKFVIPPYNLSVASARYLSVYS